MKIVVSKVENGYIIEAWSGFPKNACTGSIFVTEDPSDELLGHHIRNAFEAFSLPEAPDGKSP